VSFEKVAAHTGVKWNEAVDQLAKNAIARAKKGPAQSAPAATKVAPAAAPSEQVAKPVTEAVRAKPLPEPLKDPKTGQMSLPL
jgi:ribonuclease HI